MGNVPLSLVYERRHLSRSSEGDAYVAVDQKELLADLDGSSGVQFQSSAASERLRAQLDDVKPTALPTTTRGRFDKAS